MSELKWLDDYSGQTTDELITLANGYRIDSLLIAFDQALGQKSFQMGDAGLSYEENVVLAVEAFENELNNGGFEQFFSNSSNEYAPIIINALKNIGCEQVAELTSSALDCLNIKGDITEESIAVVMEEENVKRDKILEKYSEQFFEFAGDIAKALFEFIKQNKHHIILEF